MGQELGKAHYGKDDNSYLLQDEITGAWKVQMELSDVLLGAAIELETPRSRQRQRPLVANGNEKGYSRHYNNLRNQPKDVTWRTVIGLVSALKYIPERYSNQSAFFKYETDVNGDVVSMVNVCLVGRERDNDHRLNDLLGFIPTGNQVQDPNELSSNLLSRLIKLPNKQPTTMYVKFWEFNLDRCSREQLPTAVSAFFDRYSAFFDLLVLNVHDTHNAYVDYNELAFLREAHRRNIVLVKCVANNKWHSDQAKGEAYRKLNEAFKANGLPNVDEERKTYVCVDRHGATYDVHERLMLAEALKHVVQNRYPAVYNRLEHGGALEIFTRFGRIQELIHMHS